MVSYTAVENVHWKGSLTEGISITIFCTKHVYNIANNLGTARKLYRMMSFTGREHIDTWQYTSERDQVLYRQMQYSNLSDHLGSMYTHCYTNFHLQIKNDRSCCHLLRGTECWILKVRNFCYSCTVNLWWLKFYIIIIIMMQFYFFIHFWKMTDCSFWWRHNREL
jgi:hypothetical protein